MLVATAALCAISTVSHAEGETIAVLTKNQTNPFFQSVRVGADLAAASLKAKVVHYIPTKPDSIPEQMSQVEDLIVQKPDAIAMIPVDYKAMVPGVEMINDADIPLVNINDRFAGGESLAFIGSNDYNLGLETGRALLKKLGKGNVVILEGVKGSLSNVDRLRGLNDALKEFPNVKLIDSQPANFQRLQALQVMENLLQAHQQIDAVMAANDAMAIGAVEALDGANRKALVIGINGTDEAINAVKSGKLFATGDYGGFQQGCIGVTMAVRALRGEPLIKDIVMKTTVIDANNYADFSTPLQERKCPTWEEIENIAKK